MVHFPLLSYKFNEIIPLDKWKTTILTRIKALLPSPNEPKEANEPSGYAAGNKNEKQNNTAKPNPPKHDDGDDSDEL